MGTYKISPSQPSPSNPEVAWKWHKAQVHEQVAILELQIGTLLSNYKSELSSPITIRGRLRRGPLPRGKGRRCKFAAGSQGPLSPKLHPWETPSCKNHCSGEGLPRWGCIGFWLIVKHMRKLKAMKKAQEGLKNQRTCTQRNKGI